MKRQINPKLEIEGILLTMVDYRTNYAKEISAMLREAYGERVKIFETSIPLSVRAAEISAEGVSIFKHDPKGKVAAEYMEDFLNALIAEETRNGVQDLFGKGMDTDSSEAIQTARKAKDLLDKLTEYKPLAKVEELEEQNYNMIDNVLNNPKMENKQNDKRERASLKAKLAEKGYQTKIMNNECENERYKEKKLER